MAGLAGGRLPSLVVALTLLAPLLPCRGRSLQQASAPSPATAEYGTTLLGALNGDPLALGTFRVLASVLLDCSSFRAATSFAVPVASISDGVRYHSHGSSERPVKPGSVLTLIGSKVPAVRSALADWRSVSSEGNLPQRTPGIFWVEICVCATLLRLSITSLPWMHVSSELAASRMPLWHFGATRSGRHQGYDQEQAADRGHVTR